MPGSPVVEQHFPGRPQNFETEKGNRSRTRDQELTPPLRSGCSILLIVTVPSIGCRQCWRMRIGIGVGANHQPIYPSLRRLRCRDGYPVSSGIDRFTGRVDVLPRVAYRFRLRRRHGDLGAQDAGSEFSCPDPSGLFGRLADLYWSLMPHRDCLRRLAETRLSSP